MDNTWIKLYRKIVKNELFHDANALKVFIFLLATVDRDTGVSKTGRYWLAGGVRLPQGTIPGILKRLEKKYRVISLKPNSKFTEITILKWSLYQANPIKAVEQLSKTTTTAQQQPNTIQELRIKNISTNVDSDATHASPTKETIKRDHPYREIIQYSRDKQNLSGQYVNYAKQTMAIKKILTAGYKLEDIRFVIDQMVKDEWQQGKPFDLLTVSNRMDYFMNRVVMFKKQQGGVYAKHN